MRHNIRAPFFLRHSVQLTIACGTGPLVRRSAIPKVRCVRGYNCLRFMDRLASGGVMGCLGFRVGVSASYRHITSFSKLIHKLRHTSFGIVDLRTSGLESCMPQGLYLIILIFLTLFCWYIIHNIININNITVFRVIQSFVFVLGQIVWNHYSVHPYCKLRKLVVWVLDLGGVIDDCNY